MRVLAVLLLCAWLGTAWAGPVRPPMGKLQDCSTGCTTGFQVTGTAGETRWMEVGGAATVYCELTNQTGTFAVNVEESIDDGANWLVHSQVNNATTQCPATGSPIFPCCTGASATGTCYFLPQFPGSRAPAGRLRTNVATCTGCTYTTLCREERAVGQSW